MGRRNYGSLFNQITKRMNTELNRIGESKHDAKQQLREACERANVKWNPAQADGIFSIKTMQAYKQTAQEFSHWMKEKHAGVKHINHIQRDHVISYLRDRQDQGKSPWTVSKDMSALNKVLRLNVTKEEAQLRERSYKHTERSRVEREHDRKYNAENYREQITFAKAFGCRRESVYGGQYQVKDISLYRHDGKIYCSFIEKGGRYREAPCLGKYQPEIERIYPNITEREPLTKEQFKELYNTSTEYLFDHYTNKIDNHAYRHEYAKELYQELLDQRDPGERELYRGYDREILQEVSEALGHSRLSVVVEHYLR